VRPTSLGSGRRSLLVRAWDHAGNHSDQGPFSVDVITPSNRGELNGTDATETAKLTAAFAHAAVRRTTDYGGHATITGQLLNDAARPVAGAELHVLTRDLNRDSFVDRATVTTAADGRFSYRATASASRLVQFAWRSHVLDTRFSASAYVTLRARAAATLRAARTVRLGHLLTLTGTLRGLRPPGGVQIAAQGRSGHGQFRTFRLGRTSGGHFRIHYRFRDPSSRGRAFRIRVKILERRGWPYEPGYTPSITVRVQ
jgi:hypothetical protein